MGGLKNVIGFFYTGNGDIIVAGFIVIRDTTSNEIRAGTLARFSRKRE